ncbi:hypothetical protein BXZ70DRAFT_108047 [Cristinia sonorae]|uniref:F-box domain-containing protein n=1 Tax=Cristinia sonorae TaxID=1940300 RepID=A0A8K0UQM0_9AGAR|nr:hypothetical protein BXZ70DRAFT_108047 [Cristinia sonorae]
MSLLLSIIPSEILTAIFSSACTDTGETGRQLNLVCKAFRDLCTATGVDLQYASVRGVRRMQRFLQVLGGRDKTLRKVRSLMLVERGWLERNEEAQTPDTAVLVPLVHEILQAISADHLEVLSVYFPFWNCPSHVPVLIPVHLPQLLHLSVSGPYDNGSFVSSATAPKLMRLHIFNIARLPTNFGDHLARIAPCLTHLKVSNIDSPDPDLGRICKSFLLSRTHPSQSSPQPDHPPLPLQQITLDFRPFYRSPFKRCGTSILEHIAPIMAFRQSMPIPAQMSDVDFAAPLIVLPVPKAREHAAWIDDEDECFELFKGCWECQTFGRGGVSWMSSGNVRSDGSGTMSPLPQHSSVGTPSQY